MGNLDLLCIGPKHITLDKLFTQFMLKKLFKKNNFLCDEDSNILSFSGLKTTYLFPACAKMVCISTSIKNY